jgi:hypothetical protein
MEPVSGSINFKRHLKRVDFPAPLAPVSATASPCLISKWMFLRIGLLFLKDLLTPDTVISAGFVFHIPVFSGRIESLNKVISCILRKKL